MSVTGDYLEETRPLLARLVEGAERRSGSRMAAYETVAKSIGRSPSWVRRTIGRQPDLGLVHAVAMRIKAAYSGFCERVEADAAHDRAITSALREARNAGVSSDRRSAASAERGQRGDGDVE